MFICFACLVKFNTTTRLIKHLTLCEKAYYASVMHCLQPNCQRVFYNKNSFLRHISRVHSQDNATSTLEQPVAHSSHTEDKSGLTLDDALSNRYLEVKYCRSKGTLIDAVEVPIDLKLECGPKGFTSVGSTMQVIPIGLVLKNFLESTSIMRLVLKTSQNTKPDNLGVSNIIQSKAWTDIMATRHNDSCLHLPIILFYDDFEFGRSEIHKLGGVYISLPFLPQYLFSRVDSMFLLGLFLSSDREKSGNTTVFSKIIEILTQLKTEGVTINTKVFSGIVKFHVVGVTGANAGLNDILGFSSSFSSNYFCQVCTASKSETESMLEENEFLLRDEFSYLIHCEKNLYGIKEKCVLLSLPEFKLFSNVTIDLLHDFLEVWCQHIFNFLVTFFVKVSNLIPLECLQTRFETFDFGPDNSCRPSSPFIVENSQIRVKCSELEMLVLVRYFPLIYGEFVPEECDAWEIVILLRKILDRLVATSITEGAPDQLQDYITTCLSYYLKLSKEPLKPEFHVLLHYHKMFDWFGPHTHIWATRFNVKHRVFKTIASALNNGVSVCQSMAFTNQLLLNDLFLREENLYVIKVGRKKPCPISDFLKNVLNLNNNDKLFTVKYVSIEGNIIRKGSILTLDLYLDEFPTFGQVEEMYVIDNNVFFSFTLFTTLDFYFHYYAYEVSRTRKIVYKHYRHLRSVVPNTLTVSRNYDLYITVRQTLE